MEGVPRLPMLRSALKTSPEKSDFSRKIKWVKKEIRGCCCTAFIFGFY